MIRISIRRRDARLLHISAECSARLCVLSVLEAETLRRDGVEAWRALLKEHRAERAQLARRQAQATRLAVRLMYSPQQRPERDEEAEADRADQRIFGLRRGECEAQDWDLGGEA